MSAGAPDLESGTDPEAPHVLALNQYKSPRPAHGCPTPRPDRVFEVVDPATGEVTREPIPCGRNACPHCRRRNVQVTAAKMAFNQTLTDRRVTHAVLSTTRDWVDSATLREGWRQMSRTVRRQVNPDARYAWFREWSVKPIEGTDLRRTHYHSTWALDDDDQAAAVAAISNEVWERLAGAWSPDAHGWKPIWDAGGLARYIAGLVGHHLKQGHAPPEGWTGRRFGTSKGFYALDSRQLDNHARAAVRDERLRHHLERAMVDDDSIPDGLPLDIWDEVLTDRLEEAFRAPKPRVVFVPPSQWPDQ